MSARLLLAALLLVPTMLERPLSPQRRATLGASGGRHAIDPLAHPNRVVAWRWRMPRNTAGILGMQNRAHTAPRGRTRRFIDELATSLCRPAWRSAAVQERQLRSALPDAVDLLRLAVLAGATPRSAIAAVANHGEGAVADAFAEAQRRIDAGSALADELDRLSDSLGDLARPLLGVLRSAALDGAPLAPALDRLADELRADRRRHAEADARRLPVRMLFPLVCCALPALVLLAIVPLLVGTVRSLHL